ncbi:NAD(P)-dependent oxidoreductase [Desulfotignum balticum]|jgi:3-hydroxyisobutyrate dehydrogenase|uniref:NAD(P)-dependent oxidoreductase n=1 Tax=Desulfotignum balticum TaxID=115781 RepID=UPI0004024885|nr:NAD(P)-dependent oxidoreductase [Desulfotignum balticum]
MQISPEKTRIGFIGLGVMGHSMAGHILDSGYALCVHTRTRARADGLVKKGAVWMDSVRKLAANSDVIISIVGYPQDVAQIYLDADGILENAATGSVAIDMTTSDPALARKLAAQGREKGIQVLDAPVSGGDLGARNATLSIMVGGEEPVFTDMLPLFQVMGKNIVYQGPAGSGQHTKMANQIAIAAGMIGVCEALAYAKKAGLDPDTVLSSIGQGAAGSWSLNNLGPRMLKSDFAPGFYVKHFIKDMTIAADSARDLGLDTPGLTLAKTLYERLVDNGCENDGTQALFKLF